MGRTRNGGLVLKNNTGEDLCLLKKKNSSCLMSERVAEEKSWREKEYLSEQGAL